MASEYVKDDRESGTGWWYRMDLLWEDVSTTSGKLILRCRKDGLIGYPNEEVAQEAAIRVGDRVVYLGHCGSWHLRKPVAGGSSVPARGLVPSTSGQSSVGGSADSSATAPRPLGAITPRDYQHHSLDALFNYFYTHVGNPIVALPTGTGKSIVIAEFIRGVFQLFLATRVLSLTHVKELIEQNFKTLLKVWPTAPAGVYSAGLGKREYKQAITFAGIQSAYQQAHLFGHIDLLLVDECHLVSPKSETMYAAFIAELKKTNPKLKVIGFSATPYRLKHGMLTDADGGLFTDVAYDLTDRASFNWLISQGWLVPPVPKRTTNELDVTGVRIQGGEYVLADLQARVDKDAITIAALTEAASAAQDRKHWLIFASGIQHAEHIAEYLDSTFEIPTAVVHSKLDSVTRDRRIRDFRSGRLRAIVNNNILTTGFDYPDIDCIIMLRPTASPGLWVQMLGRGTRPVFVDGWDLATVEGRLASIKASGKPNCLVLDFAGNTKRLGPINDPVLPRKRGKGAPGIAPVRLCEVCSCYSHASARFCENPECGVEFPAKVNIFSQASMQDLIAGVVPKIERYAVTHVEYKIHKKPDKPDSMKVSYWCGLRRFNEYICLDHQGYAGRVAKMWWEQRSPWGVPPSVHDGMSAINYLKVPTHISVVEKGKYPEICGYTL